jgi:RND family efflux transporter MFP subunit
MADIGDRVKAGQPLAEIEAPELDLQVQQAKAALDQSQSTLDEALANHEQGKANLKLAQTTAQRWETLVNRGVVSRQENDQTQAQYQALSANVRALEKAVTAQRNGVAAAKANLGRLQEMKGYLVVRAPFDGVVTLRNIDVGALVNAGSTLLFRIAQIGILRTYVNVPQTQAGFIKTGQPAQLVVSNLPGRLFNGDVARTASALDPARRTMLVEVHVPNREGALLPGMYAQVNLSASRTDPPILIPGDALIVRPEGTEVATILPDHSVHLQKVNVGRDYGDRLEILNGLHPGDTIVSNPGATLQEGMKVDPVAISDQ